jgi:RNA polymerase sigma-70 factor (ECF subfamily)
MREELAALHEASFGWALACCGRDHALAEESLQVAYFKVLDGRAVFRQQSTFKTWLFGVIRLTALEQRRWNVFGKRRGDSRGEGSGDNLDELADTRRAPDSEAGARERAEQLARAMSRLAERQREVLHLVFYEDLTIAEAATVMGVSLGTARQHYERGKHILANTLEKP